MKYAMASFSDRLIGAMPVARHEKAKSLASFATSFYAARCVSAWPSSEFSTSYGWLQYFNTSLPGYQYYFLKTNPYRARAVRRTETPLCNVTIEELFQAYYDCRKRKRNTNNAIRFEMNLERNLIGLHQDLKAATYRPGQSICFVVTYPKPREIWASDFRDRIVHHLIYNRISRRFYAGFSVDSCACIPGRGTLYAVQRLERHIRSATEDHSKTVWALQMDLANFFVSIRKDVLDAQLMRRIDDAYTRYLTKLVLWNDPTKNVYIKSSSGKMAMVPAHKSLFNAGGNGLPIGNLTSQFFANVYLDDLDQYIKRTLKIRHFVRYVDDVIILGADPKELSGIANQLERFVTDQLGVRFHPAKTHIQRAEQGINFVGYVIRPYARYLRRRTVSAAHRAAKIGGDTLQQSMNSYLGLMRHSSGWHQRKKLAARLRSYGYQLNSRLEKMIAP